MMMMRRRTGGCGCGCTSARGGACRCSSRCAGCNCNRGGCAIRSGAGPPPTTMRVLRRARDIPSQASLQSQLFAVLDDHGVYTLLVLIAKVAPLPDAEIKAYTDRLLANQDHIGAMFIPKFGLAVATKVANLLREHILIADQVIDAAKSGNKTKTNQKLSQWSRNAFEIGAALFNLQQLGSSRPSMSKSDWQNEMQTHLDLLTTIVTSYIKQDLVTYTKSIDPYIKHIRHLALAMTSLLS